MDQPNKPASNGQVRVHLDRCLWSAQGHVPWTVEEELRAQHFLRADRLRQMTPVLNEVRSQVAADRYRSQIPPEWEPLDAGFIDLPGHLLHQYRSAGENSEVGRILKQAEAIRGRFEQVVVLGIGGSSLGARALFEALKTRYHNELPAHNRLGAPRIYFEGDNFDNDALGDLIELLQVRCVDPSLQEERWGLVVISKSGKTLETAAAFRLLRREGHDYYSKRGDWPGAYVWVITGEKDSRLRTWAEQVRLPADRVFTIPERVGGRFSVFTPVGLLPAAIVRLDITALLQGAADMTQRFLDEPVERNPVLLLAAAGYLLGTEYHKPLRVLALWSSKLAAVGLWYEQLVAESLGKQGRGPTPIASVHTRDLHSRGQQHQEGPRDRFLIHVTLDKSCRAPMLLGMADDDAEQLNPLCRKSYVDLMQAAYRGTVHAYYQAARPQVAISLPALDEYSLGQLMQCLMLATVVEGRLLQINPYGQPGVEAYKKHMVSLLYAKD